MKKILYIFLAISFLFLTDNGLLTAFHPCDMACCSTGDIASVHNIVPSCCSSTDIKSCNCNIEPPVRPDADRLPRAEELRISHFQTVYFTNVSKDLISHPAGSDFYSGTSGFDIYNCGISTEFSGRAPPQV